MARQPSVQLLCLDCWGWIDGTVPVCWAASLQDSGKYFEHCLRFSGFS